MEGVEGIRGAEGGSDPKFHEIPMQVPSQIRQAEYIRAPSQGLPTAQCITNSTFDTSSKNDYTNQPALTILFKMLREDGRPLPIGSFTERSMARRVYGFTGVAVERVTMVTPMDALVEFAPGTLVVTIAQALDQIDEWEDIPVWVSVLMGSRRYIMKLCQEQAEYTEQKKVMEAQVDRMHKEQQEQQEKLSELIDKVNDQARMVGEIQHSNAVNQGGSVPRISLLQSESVASSGSIPRIPSSLHTPTGGYGVTNQGQQGQQTSPKKNTKNPDLSIFSGETPTPKGGVEYDSICQKVKKEDKQIPHTRKCFIALRIRNRITKLPLNTLTVK